jgi:zinc protease
VSNGNLSQDIEFITQEGGIKEYRLANGLKILLVENRVAPVVTVMVLYRVGSRNEAVGYTGATHILEHMLFKGTPTFNKANNTQIAASLQRIGAEFNATTWYDRTNYFETVPSDKLEFAVKLEADRMRNSFIADADRQSEMTVVRNELERGQNDPGGVLDEAVYATAFREHPYHHPTIGWRADVEGVPTERLKEFYNTFYHPNNTTAIIVGDFVEDEALTLLNQYFGAYPASVEVIPEVYTDEPPQQGERRLIIRRAGELAIVQMAWRAPAALGQMSVLSNADLAERARNAPADNDIYPLVLLAQILTNGITSRLYQALVETQLAVDVYANCDQHRDPGLFNIVATVAPEGDPAKVENAILAELERLAQEGAEDAEIAKAQQQILAMEAFSRDGTSNVAMQLSEAEAVADWRFYQNYSGYIRSVTAADVRRVAQKYFTEESRTVGHFIPKNSGGAEAAELPMAALKAESQMPESGYQIPDGKYQTGNAVAPFASGRQNLSSYGISNLKSGISNLGFGIFGHPRRLFPRGLQFYDEPGAAQKSATFASRINRSQLESGATLLLLENRATPTVSLRGAMRAGSFFQPLDKSGLASMTAQMLERGTRKRDKLAIAGALESVGATLDFSTSQFALNFSGRSLTQDLPMVLATLAEMLREPSFPADELEKLKQQTVAALKEQSSQTRYRAQQRFAELTYAPGNPFYMPPTQQLIESVNATTVEDLRRFYETQYGGRSLILSLAGDVDINAVQAQCAELFAGFDGPANIEINVEDPPRLTATRREKVQINDKANIDVLLAAPVHLRRHSPDYYAATLGNSALGESTLSSRLGLKVRDEEGLTYGIGSRFQSPGFASGPWFIIVSLNPQNIERAIDSALGVLREYLREGIRPEELADEKSAAIGSAKVGLATNRGLAASMLGMEFHELGLDHVDRYPERINAVTVEEVNAAIRKHFDPDALTIVMAGDLR